MELRLSSRKWWPIRVGGGTKTTKRHAYREGDEYVCCKIDLLLSRLNERVHEKEAMKATVQATDSQMTCEVCGEVGHSWNNCPKTYEDAAYSNNRF